MAGNTEPQNGVDPRPVRPLELPAYAWRSVKQYLYRHESWCKVEHYGFCGQSCPCCRFAAGDLLGACKVGLGVRTLASVSVAVRIALTDSVDHGPNSCTYGLWRQPAPAVSRSHWGVAAAARGSASQRSVRRSRRRLSLLDKLGGSF